MVLNQCDHNLQVQTITTSMQKSSAWKGNYWQDSNSWKKMVRILGRPQKSLQLHHTANDNNKIKTGKSSCGR